ncbi:MAG: phosphate-starvation-inducible PsiE family protein [Methanolobus sp.]|nr:phosphate-starvation-inducible PsiE family protein [Methanolobus sp.]
MTNHDRLFDTVILAVTFSILYILLIAIIVGLLNIVYNVGLIIREVIGGNFIHINFVDIVVSVLTIFILIDLFKTFVDYREHKQIRLLYIIDATILIVMREIAAGVYTHHIQYEFAVSVSILLLVLGAIRLIIAKYPTDKI